MSDIDHRDRTSIGVHACTPSLLPTTKIERVMSRSRVAPTRGLGAASNDEAWERLGAAFTSRRGSQIHPGSR